MTLHIARHNTNLMSAYITRCNFMTLFTLHDKDLFSSASNDSDLDNWSPFKKAVTFDSYSDDPENRPRDQLIKCRLYLDQVHLTVR